MRLVIALIALALSACATTQQARWEWDVDRNDKAVMEKAQSAFDECKDFAYRSKVAGSRYSESDIHISCMQRRGYALKKVDVANGG